LSDIPERSGHGDQTPTPYPECHIFGSFVKSMASCFGKSDLFEIR